MTRWVMAAIVTGAVLCSPAVGQNAAEAYKAAAAKVPAGLKDAAADVRFTARGASMPEDSAAGAWEKLEGDLRANQALVAELMKATKLEKCDFALPKVSSKSTEADFKPVVALSGELRSLARLLRADAARCWSEKDADGAVERVEALYGLSVHASGTSLVITALVDDAIIGLANDMARTMAAGADGRSLSPAQKKRLRAALDKLDAADPAGLERAAKAEGGDEAMKSKIDQARAKLMQDMARTRQALGPP